MSKCLVSVILPVYNGAGLIEQAIRSLLDQTFADIEVLVIDDGSRDATAERVDSVKDSRVRLIQQNNMGLAATLNRGIALARGKYLARQDHDDISLPTRLAKQVAYMEAHPDCALLGTAAEIWVEDRPSGRFHDHPCDDAALRFELLFNNPFVHTSVMLRGTAVKEIHGYTTDKRRQPPEDFELWSRLARRHRIANLPERLVIYREVPTSVCRTQSFQDTMLLLCAENLAAATGLDQAAPVLLDTAAVIHQAWHQVSSTTDYSDMAAVVALAAEHIASHSPGSDVPTRCHARLQRLRRNLFYCRHAWVRPLFRVRRTMRVRFGL